MIANRIDSGRRNIHEQGNYLGAVFAFARLRSPVDPVVGRVRVLSVLAQVAVPERRPALELHLRDARNVRHDPAGRALHPRTRFLFFFKKINKHVNPLKAQNVVSSRQKSHGRWNTRRN